MCLVLLNLTVACSAEKWNSKLYTCHFHSFILHDLSFVKTWNFTEENHTGGGGGYISNRHHFGDRMQIVYMNVSNILSTASDFVPSEKHSKSWWQVSVGQSSSLLNTVFNLEDAPLLFWCLWYFLSYCSVSVCSPSKWVGPVWRACGEIALVGVSCFMLFHLPCECSLPLISVPCSYRKGLCFLCCFV